MPDQSCNTYATMRKNAVLIVRLPVEVKAAAQEAAHDDHRRSLSGMTVRILEEWLGEHGYLKGAKPKGKA